MCPALCPATVRQSLAGPSARRHPGPHPDQDDSGDRLDPDLFDDDEPQPEPGDFWIEPEDDEV